MPEWQFEAAGEGGPASPPQCWDLDTHTVRVGAQRLSPDDCDFELLRAATSPAGHFFPAPFRFSPQDGLALDPAAAPLQASLGPNGLLRIARASADFFDQPAQLLAVPAHDVLLVGEPAMGLVCDFAAGLAWRWSPARQDWTAAGALPPSAAGPLRPPAGAGFGYAYASSERAVAIVFPGPWQRVYESPENITPLTPALRYRDGAVLLGRSARGVGVLSAGASGWTWRAMKDNQLDARSEFGHVTVAADTLAGSCDGEALRITAELQPDCPEWPAGFTPRLGFAPAPTNDGFYFLGELAGGAPAWAFLPPQSGFGQPVASDVAASPFDGGFITEVGWVRVPGEAPSRGYRLPAGMIANVLAQFDDAVLCLGIEAGGLWAEALSGRRRRWNIRLLLCKADGSVVELSDRTRSDRPELVAVLPSRDQLLVMGLAEDEAMAWPCRGENGP